MRKVLKWIGIVFGSAVGLIALAVLVIFAIGTSRLNGTHEAPDTVVAPATDSQAVARGEHIMRLHSCQFCHGDQLQGRVFLDIPPALAVASNLTPGQGGVGATYAGQDWDRAIRYGIRPDGKMLLPFMPYRRFHMLNDRDVSYLAAYLEALPPVDNVVPASRAKFLGRIILGTKNLLPKKRAAPIPVLDPAPTAEYGAYLSSTMCAECHGDQLQGGTHPDAAAPPVPPLPPTVHWTDEQFALAMRTGKTPARQLTKHMPWEHYAYMTDTELAALRAYIRTFTAGVPATN